MGQGKEPEKQEPEKKEPGPETERARALLAAVARRRLLSPDAAGKAYEAWASERTQRPFSRYLIEHGVVPADQVRDQLRLIAVQGMQKPELFTQERFEDLLLGQLGIESQVLSPKLLSTVRAVQEKKFAEGKLRRLSELLPRAGFDPKLLSALEQHLRERALICKSCLARYPRRGIDLTAITCPRCGATIEPPAVDLQASLAASAEIERLPEETRKKLHESTEQILSNAQLRLRARGDRSRAILFACLAALLVVGGVIVVLTTTGDPGPKRPGPRPPVPPGPPPVQPKEPVTEPAPPPEREKPAVTGLQRAKDAEQTLAAEGSWSQAAETWRRALPGPADDKARFEALREERVAEMERLGALAGEVPPALAAARGAPADAALEEKLAALIVRAGREVEPPFGEAMSELEGRRAERRDVARLDAQARLAELARIAPGAEAVWEARRARLSKREHQLHASGLAEDVRDARIADLDRESFTLRRVDGTQARFRWDDDPALSLEVFREVARDSTAPEDELELLRRALLACQPLAAREAAQALGPGGQGWSPEEAIRDAPSGALPQREGDRLRLAWPTRWLPHDLTPGAGSTARGTNQGLLLEGSPARLSGREVAVLPGRPRLVLSAELDPGATTELSLGLELIQRAAPPRTYRLRWNEKSWALELAQGGGSNQVRSGTLATLARRARFELGPSRTFYRLAVSLDGVEQAETNVSGAFEAVRLHVESAGATTVVQLALEGDLDRTAIDEGRRLYEEAVERHLSGLSAPAPAAGETSLTPLSVEDALGLARLDAGQRARLRDARLALAAGRVEQAEPLLSGLPLDVPAVAWSLAWAALMGDDPSRAERLLAPLVQRDAQFAEARGLRALALARMGRFSDGVAEADVALKALPCQAHALLAQARTGLLDRDPGTVAPPTPPELLGLPLRLAPGDALVRQEVQALRESLRLQRSFPARIVTDLHAVLYEDEGFTKTAKELGGKLDALCAKLSRPFKSARLGVPRRAPVAILPRAEYDALAPASTEASWSGRHGLLLIRGAVPSDLGWDHAQAVADSWLQRTLPGLPAWVELGLAAYCVEAALGTPPPGWIQRLRTTGSWTAEQWARLFEGDRAGLASDPLARAKAWALLRLAEVRPNLRRDLSRLAELSATGQSTDWSCFTSLDLASAEKEIDAALDQRPR